MCVGSSRLRLLVLERSEHRREEGVRKGLAQVVVVVVVVAAAVAALVLRMCVVLVMAVLVEAVAHTWLGA